MTMHRWSAISTPWKMSAQIYTSLKQKKYSTKKVEEFAYVDYNHVRPHSFNGYRTPYEARTTT